MITQKWRLCHGHQHKETELPNLNLLADESIESTLKHIFQIPKHNKGTTTLSFLQFQRRKGWFQISHLYYHALGPVNETHNLLFSDLGQGRTARNTPQQNLGTSTLGMFMAGQSVLTYIVSLDRRSMSDTSRLWAFFGRESFSWKRVPAWEDWIRGMQIEKLCTTLLQPYFVLHGAITSKPRWKMRIKQVTHLIDLI